MMAMTILSFAGVPATDRAFGRMVAAANAALPSFVERFKNSLRLIVVIAATPSPRGRASIELIPASHKQRGIPGVLCIVAAIHGLEQRKDLQYPIVVGVETCIITNLLVKTYELGLEPEPEDLRRLRMAAEWVAATEFQPGVFRHHEGATHDCQNATALGVQALVRAYDALEARGEEPPAAWLDAARRGLRHYLDGQEAIGCWPYLFATIGCGQAFSERSIPDQGMNGSKPSSGPACCSARSKSASSERPFSSRHGNRYPDEGVAVRDNSGPNRAGQASSLSAEETGWKP
jgi:hypothetical protein